jgi:hypothetical protein
MDTKTFQKQLFANLNIDKELLFNIISEGKTADEVMLIYQYLTHNLDAIPQVVMCCNGSPARLTRFDVFNLMVEYVYEEEVTVYVKSQDDAIEFNGMNESNLERDIYRESYTGNYKVPCKVKRTSKNSMSYRRWMEIYNK